RAQQLAFDPAPGEEAGARRLRLLDPREDALLRAVVDHRADVGLVVARVADVQRLDLRQEALEEAVERGPLDVDALHRDAAQPGGSPASVSSSASRSAESGVWLAGFSTTGQPAASAGAILCATRLHGKLNGEIAPTTPIGRRIVKPSLPSPACAPSIGTIVPA